MKKGIIINLMFAFCVMIVSCTGMEDYLNIVGKNEIIHPGKIDSVKVYSGHNRLRIEGQCISDAQVVDCEIVWNLGRDTLICRVDMSKGPVPLVVDIELPESVYSFDLFTRDALQNRSIPVNVSAQVFGDSYLSQIRNRLYSDVSVSGTTVVITWYPLDVTLGPLYSELTYTDTSGSVVTKQSLVSDEQIELTNINVSKPVTLVTVYRPDETCLEIFRTEPHEIKLR